MTYANEEIIEALKGAREAKGLSQRALSERTGVPQSHISKIENGNADIRLSSLIELARALDLELGLVPRKALPAVESVIRSTASRARTGPKNLQIARELTRALDTISVLRTAYPDLKDLNIVQENLQTISNFRESADPRGVRDIVKPLHEVCRLTEEQQAAGKVPALPAKAQKQLTLLAERSRRIRNLLIHQQVESADAARPAYRLEKGEDDDG